MYGKVGASIVEIITESLYDKPIVIFREYVQNSADALNEVRRTGVTENLSIEIWKKQDSLYFLDNGTGIARESFAETMVSIAGSIKTRRKNMGYKGIGRLSGLSYCTRLNFVNIIDYQHGIFQTYTIDCTAYAQLRKEDRLKNMVFADLMEKISTRSEDLTLEKVRTLLGDREIIFRERSTGFLVILEGISTVLSLAIKEKNFSEELSWLLPVPFQDELLAPCEEDKNNTHLLFRSLSSEPAFEHSSIIPAEAFQISYDGKVLTRPVKRSLLREFVCEYNLEQYAVCVHSFSNAGIAINSKNPFSGIRLYIDNILLCNESELIPILQQFGMLSHPVNETIQTVRGIGAIIYIVDKVSLSANARRTFIDVTNDDAFRFLQLIGEFVEDIYQARYALSNYNSAKKKAETTQESLEAFGERARRALVRLARQEIDLEEEPIEQQKRDFSELKPMEKKSIIKAKISAVLNQRVKRYVEQSTDFFLDTYFEDFLTWLNANR